MALIADGIGSMHGVTHTIEQIRERGVPGFDVDVIGTDAGVDRRLPAAAELELPFYEGMTLGVPGLPDLVEALADGGYDLVHVTAPGPAGVAATLLEPDHRGAAAGQLPHRAGRLRRHAQRRRRRRGDRPRRASAPSTARPASSSRRARRPTPRWSTLGVEPARIGRWERGVDIDRFDPVKADRDAYPGEIKVLYAGRLTREKGVDLLAESFLRARDADPRLHLLLAGGGPEEGELRARLGEHATFLGWLGGEELARAYASADVFLFASSTDTYGQVDPRGRRQRAAGGRGRRGRPGGAGREPPHRPALPARPRPPGRRRCSSSPPRRRCATSSAPPPSTPPASRSWERALGQLARRLPAGAGRSRCRSRRPRSPLRPGSA